MFIYMQEVVTSRVFERGICSNWLHDVFLVRRLLVDLKRYANNDYCAKSNGWTAKLNVCNKPYLKLCTVNWCNWIKMGSSKGREAFDFSCHSTN